MDFEFYSNLKISNLRKDGSNIDYEHNGDILKVKNINGKKNSVIELQIDYSGYIFTQTVNFSEQYFVSDRSSFLGGGFGWYPKVNDKAEKEYNIMLMTKNKNIYSNLETTIIGTKYSLKGKDTNSSYFIIDYINMFSI